MAYLRRAFCTLLLFAAFLLSALPALAEVGPLPLAEVDVPSSLKGWEAWALYGADRERCPVYGKSKAAVCAWVSELSIQADAKGAAFSMRVDVFGPADISLPRAKGAWPQDVKVDGAAFPVLPNAGDSDADPLIRLKPGTHQISGKLIWKTMPPAMWIPEEAGLVSLTVSGAVVPFVEVDDDGQILLGETQEPEPQGGDEEGGDDGEGAAASDVAEAAAENAIEMSVHRKFVDGIPAILVTALDIRISGKQREEILGPIFPEGFVPVSVSSETLNARMDDKGRVKILARPGRHSLAAMARLADGHAKTFKMPAPESSWVGGEIWSFEPNPDLRQVTISGAERVDPKMTRMPESWKSLSAYQLDPSTALEMNEVLRGQKKDDSDEEKPRINRTIWLDFDGGAFSVSDLLSGKLNKARRIDTSSAMKLGRAYQKENDNLLITESPVSGAPGVELPAGSFDLHAEGRLERSGSDVAWGWQQDFRNASIQLHLPPGWRLLAVGGLENGFGASSWVDKWNLLSLFLLMLTAVGARHLFGWKAGAITFASMLLLIPEDLGFAEVSLALLAVEALWRFMEKTKIGKVVGVLRWGVRIVFVGVLLNILLVQLGEGVHPMLERHGASLTDGSWGRPTPSEGFLDSLSRMGLNGKAVMNEEAEMAVPMMAEEPEELDEERQVLREQVMEKRAPARMAKPSGKARAKLAASAAVDMLGAGSASFGSSASASVRLQKQRSAFKDAYKVDAGSAAQTGEGLPKWSWRRYSFDFQGPVTSVESISLTLIPPWLHRIFSVLRALLILIVAAVFFGFGARLCLVPPPASEARGASGASAVAVLLAAVFASMMSAGVPANAWAVPQNGTSSLSESAAIPSAILLSDLRSRLLKRPACTPDCAAIQSLKLNASLSKGTLQMELTVHAAEAAVIALPTLANRAFPTSASIDGASKSSVLMRDDDGTLWAFVTRGIHKISLAGTLPGGQEFHVELPSHPRSVEASAEGFEVSGIDENGTALESTIVFSKKSSAAEKKTATEENSNSGESGTGAEEGGEQSSQDNPEAAVEDGSWKAIQAPYFNVVRTLSLGLTWQVETQVSLVSLSQGQVRAAIEIPLLPGEKILTEDIQVTGNKVKATFSPDRQHIAWLSSIEQASDLTLSASSDAPIFERWEIDVGRIWHVEYGGDAPILSKNSGSSSASETALFRPLPGEKVTMKIDRPKAVEGARFTIKQSNLSLTPGTKELKASLRLEIASAIGEDHPIRLPAAAHLNSVTLNGRKVSLPLSEEGVLSPKFTPGNNILDVDWTEPYEPSFLWRVPEIDLGSPSVNATTKFSAPESRWILAVGGAPASPVVRFWALLLGLGIVAFLLSRFGHANLGFLSWTLLLAGLAPMPDSTSTIIVGAGWLLFMGWRERTPDLRPWAFNLRQIVVIPWLLVFLLFLLHLVVDGLLSTPDMLIDGNGSSLHRLNWFADRTNGHLSGPWVISAPILVYKCLMFAWALWLAVSLIRWLRWAFKAFATGGMWKVQVGHSDAPGNVAATTVVSSKPAAQAPASDAAKSDAKPAPASDSAKKKGK